MKAKPGSYALNLNGFSADEIMRCPFGGFYHTLVGRCLLRFARWLNPTQFHVFHMALHGYFVIAETEATFEVKAEPASRTERAKEGRPEA